MREQILDAIGSVIDLVVSGLPVNYRIEILVTVYPVSFRVKSIFLYLESTRIERIDEFKLRVTHRETFLSGHGIVINI